jgi:hypothetical protein
MSYSQFSILIRGELRIGNWYSPPFQGKAVQIKGQVLPEISDRAGSQPVEISSGVVAGPFPSFQRRGSCASIKDPVHLTAQTGWLVISNNRDASI